LCRPGLAAAIETPRIFTQASLPTGPTWDEVRQMFALVGGDRPVDIRDRALLLLLAVYGLRSGEIIRLRLDDFDWDREVFTVTRSKSLRSQPFPLSPSVAAALIRYLGSASTDARANCSSRTALLCGRSTGPRSS
jgi:integrase